jgi:hypothetical protein
MMKLSTTIQVFLSVILLAAILSACQPPPDKSTSLQESPAPQQSTIQSSQTTTQEIPSPSTSEIQAKDTPTTRYGYTHQQPDGNRWLKNPSVPFENVIIDLQLSGQPFWLAAAQDRNSTIWAVVLENGRVLAFKSSGTSVDPIAIIPDQLPPQSPPLLIIQNGIPSLITVPSKHASPITHPIPLGSEDKVAFVESSGDLVIWENQEIARFPLNALPDARLLTDEQQRILLYTDATSTYTHGVLGDEIESGSISIIETMPFPRILTTIIFSGGKVAEGISPVWTDLDSDGKREIIVTLSDADQGAQIVVYSETGEKIAEGPTNGQGYRWRHQIAVAPFGPNAEMEIVAVRTPHIAGIAEFYTLDEGRLIITAELPGVSSHTIGSRNLDMAAAIDLDADGQPELLVPNQSMTEIEAIRRVGDNAELTRSLPVDGRISTNLVVVSSQTTGISLGIGRTDNTLRLWLPR